MIWEILSSTIPWGLTLAMIGLGAYLTWPKKSICPHCGEKYVSRVWIDGVLYQKCPWGHVKKA